MYLISDWQVLYIPPAVIPVIGLFTFQDLRLPLSIILTSSTISYFPLFASYYLSAFHSKKNVNIPIIYLIQLFILFKTVTQVPYFTLPYSYWPIFSSLYFVYTSIQTLFLTLLLIVHISNSIKMLHMAPDQSL